MTGRRSEVVVASRCPLRLDLLGGLHQPLDLVGRGEILAGCAQLRNLTMVGVEAPPAALAVDQRNEAILKVSNPTGSPVICHSAIYEIWCFVPDNQY